jgi:RNAse (barnase) inhibitor barstar
MKNRFDFRTTKRQPRFHRDIFGNFGLVVMLVSNNKTLYHPATDDTAERT